MTERTRKIFVDKDALLSVTRALETGERKTLPPGTFIDANVAFSSGNTPWQFKNPSTKAIPVVHEHHRKYDSLKNTYPSEFTRIKPHLTREGNPITDSLTELEKNILYSLALGEKEMSLKSQLGSREKAENVFGALQLKARKVLGIDPTFDVMRVLLATATREGLLPVKPPSININTLSKRHLEVLQLLGEGHKPAQIKAALHVPDQEYKTITDNFMQQFGAKTQMHLVAIVASMNL